MLIVLERECLSVAEGGSTDSERKADHWSARTVLTKEEGEEVKGTENEGQGMVVVILGMQPLSNETDGGFVICEVEDSKQHVSKSKVQQEE